MTIDERLDKLTGRHEALAQTVELLVAQGLETGRNIDKLTRDVATLCDGLGRVSGDISNLLTIVTIQNERIKRLEDRPN